MSIGPSRPLVLEKPEAIDLKQAARYFGQRGETDASTEALLKKCAVPLLAAATPRAVWLEGDVDSLTEAGLLQGSDVFRHLTGCHSAVLLAVTLGPGVDAQIRRAGIGDIRPPRRSVRHRHQPDDPAQEHHGAAGGQRPPGQGTSCGVRPLCAAHPL